MQIKKEPSKMMPDELAALRAENLSLKENIAYLEAELEKRTVELQKKTSQCDDAKLQIKNKNLKIQEEITKSQRQSLKFERKISELKDEIIELHKNRNPDVAQLLSEINEKFQRAKALRNRTNKPQIPDQENEPGT